jgi:phospholipid/cholesterol/gamma-HCH transport system substrate-binding protein
MAAAGAPRAPRRRTAVERDARYAAVAIFALAAIAAAFAFVWWYSGQGDRRSYERYEIYFDGSVSGLSQGSPVRYLGVDVGRVRNLSVARRDSEAPLSGATRARLGLLGLTGLLYIDLQLDPEADPARALESGDNYPVIMSRKGDIEAFLERLPDLIGHAGAVMTRVEALLADDNLRAVDDSLRNVREATMELPGLMRNVAALAADLRTTTAEATALTQRLNAVAAGSQSGLEGTLKSAQVASETLARTAESLERIVAGNEAALSGLAGPGAVELQQLVLDVRDASTEIRALARSLRENPSSLLREAKEHGVEIAK